MRKKRQVKKRMGSPIIFAIAILLMGSMAVRCAIILNKNAKLDEKAAVIQKQIDAENERAKELEEQESYMKTDDYIEDVAHERLGLVHPNEILVTPSQE